jgi:23S rRNA (cytosine1962-C5)-methyltransferase
MFNIFSLKNFDDYALLDSGDGERLEKFGKFIIRKPDPQVLWKRSLADSEWEKADAVFDLGGTSNWLIKSKMPERWQLSWNDIKFWVEPTPFKHLGVFPEQAAHWEWMRGKIEERQKRTDEREKIKDKREEGAVESGQLPVKVLNLFGYTGIASVVCAKSGAQVTHVDASKPSIGWAKENMILTGLPENSIRWILEDVLSFLQREVRRGNKYDAIIMDPPVFGHGAKGEVWKFNENFPELMTLTRQLLSPNPLFVIVNAYAVSASALMLQNVLEDSLRELNGKVDCGELVLKYRDSERLLSTGIFGRVSW